MRKFGEKSRDYSIKLGIPRLTVSNLEIFRIPSLTPTGICTTNLKRFLNMSTKLSYDEAMGISNTNSHSQFTHCLSQKHIKLMPKYLGNVKSGVVQQLDSEVFVYSKEYVSHSSVPVSFAAPKLTIRKVNVN